MSYNIWLEIDTGGPRTARVGSETWNYTSNCVPMWRAAGADLAEFDGKLAGECIPILDAALAALRDDPARFKAMNPANGWGAYETLVLALEKLRRNFAYHPKATVCIWR